MHNLASPTKREKFYPPYLMNNSEDRKKTQNSDLSFEIQEPIIVNPVRKEPPKVDIHDVSEEDQDDDKKDQIVNVIAPIGNKQAKKNPSGRVKPFKSKPFTSMDPPGPLPNIPRAEMSLDDLPKVPEKVMNPTDLMPQTKKNPMNFNVPESTQIEKPVIENYPVKRPATVKIVKSKKPIDLSDQENDSKLFNAPKLGEQMPSLPNYLIESKVTEDEPIKTRQPEIAMPKPQSYVSSDSQVKFPVLPGTTKSRRTIPTVQQQQEEEVSVTLKYIPKPVKSQRPTILVDKQREEYEQPVQQEQYPDYLASIVSEQVREPVQPVQNETPEAHVVDFIESTERIVEKDPDQQQFEQFGYPGQFTTMQAMKLAKIHQSSPYEARTDIITKIRDRQTRDSVKDMNNQHYMQPVSPRRRNAPVEYSKRISVKSKPGANYVSPYSKQKLLQQIPFQQQQVNNVSFFNEDQNYLWQPKRAKSPIKPYLIGQSNDPFSKYMVNNRRTRSPLKTRFDLHDEQIDTKKRSFSQQQPGYFKRFFNRFFKKDNEKGEQHSLSSIEDINRSNSRKKRQPFIKKKLNNSQQKQSKYKMQAPQIQYAAEQHQKMLQSNKSIAVKSKRPELQPYISTPNKRNTIIIPYSTPNSKTKKDIQNEDLERFENRQTAIPENIYWQNKKPEPIIKEKPIEYVQPIPLPVKQPIVKSKGPPIVKSMPPIVKSMPPIVKSTPPPVKYVSPIRKAQPQKDLEFVIRVGMKEQPEPEEIHVYEGDQAKELCNRFCVKHKITDRQRQFNLLKVIEHQIEEHRSPKIQVKQPQVEPVVPQKKKGQLHPNIRKRVLEIFNEVFYDYDEEWGRIEIEKFKQVMRFVKIREKVPDLPRPEDDPFSDINLEKEFDREEKIKYIDQEQKRGTIHHRSVMYICHDIYEDIIRKGRISKNLEWLRTEDTKRNKKIDLIDQKLKKIDEKMDDLDNTAPNFDI